ncbi:MAG: APC family permease [Actinobacteria bacterium]|nr:APC family permease [Actinomycetota bacterium]
MATRLKRLLVGRALASHKAEHQLLPKRLALPVFSSDPLSSNAYATEEMMLVLVTAGTGALSLMFPIGAAIALLLVIVITSYRQTVRAYPHGGGSYIVSRENLGTLPGLVAAAAILTDYVLTVAVSMTAGTVAVTSAAPSLTPYRVEIALVFVALVTLANLRGVREAGRIFAVPTYGFVAVVYITLATGFVRCLGGCPVAESAGLPIEAHASLTLFLIFRAFASGATALTGVEAIADGVQAFRRPQSRNAATTLAIMGTFSISMFLGITFLARRLGIRVAEDLEHQKSVLAQIGDTVFDGGFMFIALQVFTAGILFLAANTAYQDFPRLSAILARDRFMPSQFRNRGDRLVYSNGVLVLAVVAGFLIWFFDAELTRLIQLYVVGVFTAFTLSQSGMVRRWLRVKGERWRRSLVINAIGAATTGVVLVIVSVTKFTRGAWMVIAAMPVFVLGFLAVQRHYASVSGSLRSRGLSAAVEASNTVVLLVQELDLAVGEAVAYLRTIRPQRVIPLYTGPGPLHEDLVDRWRRLAPRLGDLVALPGDRSWRSLRDYLRAVPREENGFVTVIVPEVVRSRSVIRYLRQAGAFRLKLRLFFEPELVVANVPLLPEEIVEASQFADRPVEPTRSVVIVPISAVHDATVEAVRYAKALRAAHVEGLFFAGEQEEVGPLLEDWAGREIDVPLSVVEAPFRDIGPPLLDEVRGHTGRGDTVVTVVLPEFVVSRWWHHLLHNQSGFYVKRLLLFEPRVVVTSVPFHL